MKQVKKLHEYCETMKFLSFMEYLEHKRIRVFFETSKGIVSKCFKFKGMRDYKKFRNTLWRMNYT